MTRQIASGISTVELALVYLPYQDHSCCSVSWCVVVELAGMLSSGPADSESTLVQYDVVPFNGLQAERIADGLVRAVCVHDDAEPVSPHSETGSAALTPFRSSGGARRFGISFSEGHSASACCASTLSPASRLAAMIQYAVVLDYTHSPRP